MRTRLAVIAALLTYLGAAGWIVAWNAARPLTSGVGLLGSGCGAAGLVVAALTSAWPWLERQYVRWQARRPAGPLCRTQVSEAEARRTHAPAGWLAEAAKRLPSAQRDPKLDPQPGDRLLVPSGDRPVAIRVDRRDGLTVHVTYGVPAPLRPGRECSDADAARPLEIRYSLARWREVMAHATVPAPTPPRTDPSVVDQIVRFNHHLTW